MNYNNRPYEHTNKLNICFASPGGGKTTLYAHIVDKLTADQTKVYGNVPLTLPEEQAKYFRLIENPRKDIGKYDYHDCVILIDESGVDFNNRDWKNTTQAFIKYIKYHRHFRCTMWWFSQSYNDMDKTIRTLADNIYYINKTFLNSLGIGTTFKIRKIDRMVGINELTSQLEDMYKFKKFSGYRFKAHKLFKMFDSYCTYPLEPIPNDIVVSASDKLTTSEKLVKKIRALFVRKSKHQD